MYDKLEAHLRALESLGVTSDKNAAMLYPMVESSLPEELLKVWHRSSLSTRDGSTENPPRSRLDYLMEFLRKEVEGEERIALARTSYSPTPTAEIKKVKNKKVNLNMDNEEFATAAGLFVGQGSTCIFCDKSHESKECFKAQSMSLEEKKTCVQVKRCCFTCLKPGHQTKTCKAMVRCFLCSKKHVVLMCPDAPSHKKTNDSKPVQGNDVEATLSSMNCTNQVLLKTIMVVIRNGSRFKKVRTLIDSGSQRSYLLKKTAEELRFCPKAEINLNHVLFGGSIENRHHAKYQIQLESVNRKFSRVINVLDQQKICGSIPKISAGLWMNELNLNGIRVNDEQKDIELLLGSDNYGALLTGRIHQLENGLTAVETYCGWTVFGEVSGVREESSLAMTVTSLLINEASVEQLWSMETIGIRDPAEIKSKAEKEEAAQQYFLETVTRTEEGRYAVSLPWIVERVVIPDNRRIAEKRLLSTTGKLNSAGKYQDYEKLFLSWLEEGIIEEVSEDLESPTAHYLPHRAVFKPGSETTPIRPVFDASCKTARAPSLNDCLEKGPNLLELIPSLLVRFREKKVGVVSDVRKAFLMVEVHEKDRDYLRFLWWESYPEKTYRIFRHKRVFFGINCGPFLLGAVIGHHLNQVTNDHKETAGKLLKSLYVDNCVTSVDTMDDYNYFKNQATKLMAEACMNLRQWEYGPMEFSGIGQLNSSGCGLESGRSGTLENINRATSSVLGMKWNRVNDTLSCETICGNIVESYTKRSMFSLVQKVFDPLGILCPVLLIPKLMLQNTWAENIKWDDELNDDMKVQFTKWIIEISHLNSICIPRNITGEVISRENWQVHTFCDASQDAYAAVVFLRTVQDNVCLVQLVQAKSRVAPLKKTTIPRLGLLACTIGARLTASVKEALSLTDVSTYFWSDSTTALTWIKRNDDWGSFVGNRVREICQLTASEDWRHVPGVLNPADLPSRGCGAVQLAESKWWEGPHWLKLSSENWPNQDFKVDEQLVIVERTKSSLVSMTASVCETPWYGSRFSSYSKNIRVIAWIRRFVNKSRKNSDNRGPLKVNELKEAEKVVMKLIQTEVFAKTGDVISGLQVQRDEDGLIRVKTKLLYRKDTESFRFPYVLPHSHPMLDQLLMEIHRSYGHAGAQFMLGKLREKFWIVQGRKAIRKILSKCTTCLRYTAKAPRPPPAPLPEDRVKTAKVFEIVGIDLAGPLYLRDGSKIWIVIFTCAVYRCVHMELVTSLSTNDFLDSLVRFMSRRGTPYIIYCDNGTNFVGAANAFRQIDWGKIMEVYAHKIEWKFNPPSAAWWGGWWERLIRSVKDLLKRMLGRSRLTSVEMLTCLCQVESTMNGRPLTCVTEDPEDLIPLTPAMFLHEMPVVDLPHLDLSKEDRLRERFKFCQKLRADLKSRFRKEYLSLLVQRGKVQPQMKLKVGDLVFVGADNKKRIGWPKARILELFPGKDGVIRVARVKTESGILTRPIQRLYPMEISSSSEGPVVTDQVKTIAVKKHIEKRSKMEDIPVQEVQTRSGRLVKAPSKYQV